MYYLLIDIDSALNCSNRILLYRKRDYYSGKTYWRINLKIEQKANKHLWNQIINVGKSSSKEDIWINNPHYVSRKYIKKILRKSSQSSCIGFLMSNGGKNPRIGPFVTDLARILPKCQLSIQLFSLIFTQRDFQHIINCSLNSKKLWFED